MYMITDSLLGLSNAIEPWHRILLLYTGVHKNTAVCLLDFKGIELDLCLLQAHFNNNTAANLLDPEAKLMHN